MPRTAKNKAQDIEQTKVELDHTTPLPDAETKTKRTAAKRAEQERNEPNLPDLTVDGKKQTQRKAPTQGKKNKATAKSKVELNHTTVPSPHYSETDQPAQLEPERNDDKVQRCTATPYPAPYCDEPDDNEPSWVGAKYFDPSKGTPGMLGGVPESSRDMIERAIARAEARPGSRKNPLKPRSSQEQMSASLGSSDPMEMLTVSIELYNMPKVDLHDADAVRQRIADFFAAYRRHGLRPTLAGMGLALGIDRRRLREIKTGAAVKNKTVQLMPAEVKGVIKDAYDMMEVLWESYMLSGRVNPVSGIFIAKNQFDYVDRVDYTLAPGEEDQQRSMEDIRSRYMHDDDNGVETEFTDE